MMFSLRRVSLQGALLCFCSAPSLWAGDPLTLAGETEKQIKGPASPSSYALENLASQGLSDDFKGVEGYDPTLPDAIRMHFTTQNSPEKTHCDALTPFVLSVQNFFSSPITSFQQELSQEISEHLHSQTVTPEWAFLLPVRILSENAETFADERDIFEHTPYPKLLRGLSQTNKWKTFADFRAGINSTHQPYDPIKQRAYPQNIHPNFQHTLKTELAKYFLKLSYPMIGQEKMGISFLVDRMIEGVFPIAIPDSSKESIQAHGTQFSRLGFATHDYLHKKVSPVHFGIWSSILIQLDAHFNEGGNVRSFAPASLAHHLDVHQTLTESWKTLHHLFLTDLMKEKGESTYKRVMAGWFLSLHEYPYADSSFYTETNFNTILQTMSSGSLNILVGNEVWESPHDPLVTSPLTGKSELTKKEITQIALRDFLKMEKEPDFTPPSYYQTQPFPDAVEYLKSLIEEISITSSKRFIDVHFRLSTGQEKRLTFPTLFHKWQNMEDSLSLLAAGGIRLERPNLETAGSPRQKGVKTLEKVRRELGRMIEDFRDTAIKYVSFQDSAGHSLARSFTQKREDQNQKLTANTQNLLKAAQENKVKLQSILRVS